MRAVEIDTSEDPRIERVDVRPVPSILTLKEASVELRCSKAHLSHIVNGKVDGLPPSPHARVGRREAQANWLRDRRRPRWLSVTNCPDEAFLFVYLTGPHDGPNCPPHPQFRRRNSACRLGHKYPVSPHLPLLRQTRYFFARYVSNHRTISPM